MFNQEELNKHPELIAFLNASTEEEREQLARDLQPKYSNLGSDPHGHFSGFGGYSVDVESIIAAMGRLDHLNTLLRVRPDHFGGLNGLVSYAVLSGNIDVVNRILQDSRGLNGAIRGTALSWACSGGKLSLLNRLLEFPAVQASAANTHNVVLRKAAIHGHTAIVDRLLELQCVRENINELLVMNEFSTSALRTGLGNVMDRFLPFPKLFAYFESHDQEFGQSYVYPFVAQKLQALQEQKTVFEQSHPNGIFDVTGENAQLYFYMIRNLIRRNSPELHDHIRLLLEIPAVKQLAHTAVTPNMPNELLRLAQTTENQDIAAVLLNIPAVQAETERNNFYRNEARGHFDLRAVAEDRESSMRALSTSEQKRLSQALERYLPIMTTQGIEPLFQHLKKELENRYLAHPAQVQASDGRVIDLPISWDDWKKLAPTLSADTRKQALKAYYQHKDLSALRYLSRPNQWMAENAGYVNCDSNGSWSTFEEYKPLITMLWLAAGDKEVVPTDGFTIETRIDHFIDELAHLGRAHNWDQARIKTDTAGRPLLNEDGMPIKEEFDDGQGDKPSCYSGVKCRLFQSVLGHPLLKILTIDDIKQELREFVREHFKQQITDTNRDAIHQAWTRLCDGDALSETQKASLADLNLPEEKQISFLHALSVKYPAQFNEDPAFKRYIEASFQLTKVFEWHAVRFSNETVLDSLLKPRASAMSEATTSAEILKAKTRLNRCEALGEAVIAEINCLTSGNHSQGASNWAGSQEKLMAIIAAVNTLPETSTTSLCMTLMDEQSELSKSLFKPLSSAASAPGEVVADTTVLNGIRHILDEFQGQIARRACK